MTQEENEKYEKYLGLSERYPAFAYAILAALRNAPDEEARRPLRARLADNVGDPDSLRELLGQDSESLVDFYPDTLRPDLDTDATIDAFISRFGADQPLPPAVREIAETTAAAPKAPETPDAPRARQDPDEGPDEESRSDNSGDLSMSFAKILIKNGNYAKALEIITQLNLKFPEKSIYFADQIRFLRKLIRVGRPS